MFSVDVTPLASISTSEMHATSCPDMSVVASMSVDFDDRTREIQNPSTSFVDEVGGIPPLYVTKPTRSTQPCIPLGSLNRVPALIGWGKGGNVTSAGWQVTLCDPIWHVSSRSGAVLVAQTAIRFLSFPFLYSFRNPSL